MKIYKKMREKCRRFFAILLCLSMVMCGMPLSVFTTFAANDDVADYIYEINGASFVTALKEAVSEGNALDKELKFMGETSEEYDELFMPDGTLYELDWKTLDIERNAEREKDAILRVFVRIEGDIALDEDYVIDGDEDILFLIQNKGREEATVKIRLDERETETISVPIVDDIEVSNEDLESLKRGFMGGTGIGGSPNPRGLGENAGRGGYGEDEDTDFATEEQERGEHTDDDSLKDSDVSIEDDISGKNTHRNLKDKDKANDHAHDKNDPEPDKEDGRIDNNRQGADKDNGRTDNSKRNSYRDNSGSDKNGQDLEKENKGSDNSDKGLDKENNDGNSDKENDSMDNAGHGLDKQIPGSDKNNNGSGTNGTLNNNRTSSGSSDAENSKNTKEKSSQAAGSSSQEVNKSVSVSLHNSNLLSSSLASASNADPASASDADKASPSDAVRLIDGTLYDPVWFENKGAVAFVTTMQGIGLKDFVSYSASDGDVVVTVKLPAGALPKNAELIVMRNDEDSPEYADALELITEYRETDEYRETASADTPNIMTLSSEGDDCNDEGRFTFCIGSDSDQESEWISLDISFYVNGEEVEPSYPADVTIDVSAVPEISEGIVESFEVWHMEDETMPVLVASVSDPEEAASGVALFSVESFSNFYLHITNSAGGWAGLGINLLDVNGNSLNGSLNKSGFTYSGGVGTATVDMPYVIDAESFANDDISGLDSYAFSYATLTDPNYGDTTHDLYPDLTNVGAKSLYGSKEDSIVSVTVYQASAADSSYNQVSKTWGYTITYESGDTDTLLIYGNASGGNDSGGLYCPVRPELNLYYDEALHAVFNLGNGNGTYSDGDYTGSSSSGGNALRYGTGALDAYVDEGGKVAINLPSDNDLDKEFTVVNAVGTEGKESYLPAVTITLGKEEAYDYKLIGWINIATGEYYDVSGGTATAEIDLSNNNVFYADWIAASYDKGFSSDEGLREDTVSTSAFVNFDLFDYNELFNLYSVALKQNGTASEEWTDSESFYSKPLLGNDPGSQESLHDSFIFQNNGTTRSNVHVLSHANPARWNLWTGNAAWDGYPEYNFVLDAGEYWNVTGPDSSVLGMLYDRNAESIGVHYVGSGDYLFWVDENGYYTYDSAVSGAAYNQSDGRFYVYNDNANAFFPYNDHTEAISSSNGLTDYWFGMSMDVDFYLPNSTSGGSEDSPVNQVNGKDMVFDFSGDDDIMIFVDGEMVCDMSGIHSTSYSRINFSNNTVTISMGLDETGAPDTTGAGGKYSEKALDLWAGSHTLNVRYMERGAAASNLKVQFNITPAWEYGTGPVQTVTAEKMWVDTQGNEIDPQNLPDKYKENGVEVGLFDILGPEADGVFGYTKDDDIYTVIFTDDNGITRTYIYNASMATLTYTEVSSDGSTTVGPETDDQTDSEGRVVDKEGYIVAWLDNGNLHIRMNKQTLNSENNWFYAWELLDPDGEYEVMELSTDSAFTTEYTKKELDTYDYWSIIGENEIETFLKENQGSDLAVVLTEAAQETTETLGNTKEAKGWVIVGAKDEVTTEQVKFSQIATLEEIEQVETGTVTYYGTYGVTSQSEIDTLGSGAVWYIEDAGKKNSEDEGALEEFRLYCLLDGVKYYLALDQNTDSLMVSAQFGAAFYYDALGELMVDISDDSGNNNIVRIEIDEEGNILIGEAEDKAAVDDVRIYTLSATNTSGFSVTAVNTILPDFSLVKIDSSTERPLAGVGFSLKNDEGLYYGGLDEDSDEVKWETAEAAMETDANGQIIFHYLADGTYTLTEMAAADGYALLPSAVTLTIEDGKITSFAWTKSSVGSEIDGYIDTSEGGLTITVKNTPGMELPQTGGLGTAPFYMLGLILTLGSLCFFCLAKRLRQSRV